jgi:hypothetical protein
MVPRNEKVLFIDFSSAVQFKFLEELRSLLLAVSVSSRISRLYKLDIKEALKKENTFSVYMEPVVTNYCKAMLST